LGTVLDFVTLFGKAESMRRKGLTDPSAFHHMLNSGIKGEYIFPDDGDKQTFFAILSGKAKILGVHFEKCKQEAEKKSWLV
jgi:hypothetical protein